MGAPRFRTRWLTSGFLALEFALAFVLIANVAMVSAGALHWRGQRVTDLTPLLSASIALPERSYASMDERRAFYDRLIRQIDGLPGVTSAAWTSHLPMAGAARRQLIVEGLEPAPLSVIAAGRDFFDTVGLSLLRGRIFTERDGLPGSDNVIVNQRFVEVHLPGRDVVGARIRIGAGTTSTSSAAQAGAPERTIVGVVDSMREWSTDDSVPIVYQPFRGESPASAVLVVRADNGEPAALAPALREAVRQIDPNLALHRTMSAEQALHELRWNGRISNAIILTISTIALILAVSGLVVVTAHSVTERTSEIGLRIAVGAGTARIVRLVLGRALVQVVTGLALGVALLFALGSIFPVPSTADDAALLAGVILLVAAVGLVACAAPALRATRIDPVRALRSE